MRQLGKALLLAAALVLAAAASAPAQTGGQSQSEYNDKVRRLEKVIQAQQRQLEAQQKQLLEQRKLLLELQKQVKGMAAPPAKAAAPAATSVAKPAGKPLPARAGMVPANSRESGPHAAKADQGPWTGSFDLKGVKTRFAIGGFAQLDVIYDSGAITNQTEFVTANIVTRNATKAQGDDGQTNFSVNATQLWFETRTDLDRGSLRTYLSMDFYADTSGNDPKPRLREAYGELTKYVGGGDLLAGQAWSTSSYMPSVPNTLDYEGPSAIVAFRQPQVRWSHPLGHGLTLKLAAETPTGHEISGADSLTAWPDGVAALEWKYGLLRVQGTGLLRDLRASKDNGPTENVLGWGFNGAGVLDLPYLGKNDNFTFSLVYGKGMGSVINDAPPDAYYDAASGSLELVPVWGYMVGLEHWWSPHWASVFTYSALRVDNLDAQPYDAYHAAQYASANLMWTPTSWWLLGGELLWGERVDKDGADGNDTRLQITTKFTF